jgi:hypothetical protein
MIITTRETLFGKNNFHHSKEIWKIYLLFISLLLLLMFTGYHKRQPIQCSHYWSIVLPRHYWSIVLPHLSCNHSSFIHQSCLAVTSRHLAVKQEKISQKWPWILPTSISFHTCRDLKTCCKIIWHGADGFMSSPKKSCYGFSSSLKIHCPLPGLNPQTLNPMASTITTRPPRPITLPLRILKLF